MKIVTLLENTSSNERICAAHGLSLYVETRRHKLLFDMGPDVRFAENAAALGVDLSAVDTAILSHGHSDHGGGIRAFCEVNTQAEIYVHQDAFGEYYALKPGEEPEYIGLERNIWELESRIVPTGALVRLDEELTLFADEGEDFPAFDASARLRVKTGADFLPDRFPHEQNLVVDSGGRGVIFAGCAHRGVVNILRRGTELLGREPDAVVGGFHLFQLVPGDPKGDALIRATGEALLPGKTVYYTGHCTGDYAYGKLKEILGDRLRPISGGTAVEL